MGEEYEVRPFLPVRRASVDVLHAGHRKDLIHGPVEFDVTDARRLLRGGGAVPALRPVPVAGRSTRREMLAVTLSFGHDVVDGAPPARFSARLGDFLESGHGPAGSAGEAGP
jgi:hypothetical protein